MEISCGRKRTRKRRKGRKKRRMKEKMDQLTTKEIERCQCTSLRESYKKEKSEGKEEKGKYEYFVRFLLVLLGFFNSWLFSRLNTGSFVSGGLFGFLNIITGNAEFVDT